jgi:hypothetical protein
MGLPGPQGPQGEQGPPGSGGGSDAFYAYTQGSPAASWPINHGLGKYPAIAVVDSGGTSVIPDVSYIDSNNVVVTFGSSTSGKAYFN